MRTLRDCIWTQRNVSKAGNSRLFSAYDEGGISKQVGLVSISICKYLGSSLPIHN